MISEKHPVLTLENGKPVACEDCAPIHVYIESGFRDDEVIWRKCTTCEEEASAFTRTFWDEKVQWRKQGDVTESNQICIRANGVHYVIGNGNKNSPFLGHGGHSFSFTFIDGPYSGQTITSFDVWTQGDIHPDYLKDLPDNAVQNV